MVNRILLGWCVREIIGFVESRLGKVRGFLEQRIGELVKS
jgi:hypothetical protein